MTPNLETVSKILRLRPQHVEVEAKNHDGEAKILASRPIWPRCLNIPGMSTSMFDHKAAVRTKIVTTQISQMKTK